MKWSETTASECRYGEIAGRIWGDWDVLWERSEADYQGSAEFLALNDGKYCFYEWSYGSCSCCDTWESDNASDETIEQEMRSTAMWFSDRAAVECWIESLESTRRDSDSKKRCAELRAAVGLPSDSRQGGE